MSTALRELTDIQLRPREAALKLGISPATFWALAKRDPDFPRLTRFGNRCTTVSAKALDKYIESKTGV